MFATPLRALSMFVGVYKFEFSTYEEYKIISRTFYMFPIMQIKWNS